MNSIILELHEGNTKVAELPLSAMTGWTPRQVKIFERLQSELGRTALLKYMSAPGGKAMICNLCKCEFEGDPEKTFYCPECEGNLARMNCEKAGQPGHHFCGYCPKCAVPRFQCGHGFWPKDKNPNFDFHLLESKGH